MMGFDSDKQSQFLGLMQQANGLPVSLLDQVLNNTKKQQMEAIKPRISSGNNVKTPTNNSTSVQALSNLRNTTRPAQQSLTPLAESLKNPNYKSQFQKPTSLTPQKSNFLDRAINNVKSNYNLGYNQPNINPALRTLNGISAVGMKNVINPALKYGLGLDNTNNETLNRSFNKNLP